MPMNGVVGVSMHVTEHLQDGVLVLTISGRFTFYSRKVFQAILKNAGTTKVRQILVIFKACLLSIVQR